MRFASDSLSRTTSDATSDGCSAPTIPAISPARRPAWEATITASRATAPLPSTALSAWPAPTEPSVTLNTAPRTTGYPGGRNAVGPASDQDVSRRPEIGDPTTVGDGRRHHQISAGVGLGGVVVPDQTDGGDPDHRRGDADDNEQTNQAPGGSRGPGWYRRSAVGLADVGEITRHPPTRYLVSRPAPGPFSAA